MSILNVNTIQPIGSGTTVTVAATELKTSNFITVGTGASVTSPSANVLTLGTNSAERLRITSAGLIGIGTVSPSGSIHAHVASGTQRSYLEASAAHSFLRLKSGSTSYNSGLEFFSGASNIANVNGLGAGGLQFEVNGSERLRITSTGNLGIKVTNPDLTLHVNGVNALPSTSGSTPAGHLTLRAKAQSSSHGMFMGVSNASPWSSWIQAQDANNNATNYPLLLNPNGGLVGIATAVPSYRLDIGDGATDPANGYQLRVNASGDYIFALQRQSVPSFSIRNNSTGIVHLNTQNSKILSLGVSSGNASGSIEDDVRIDSNGHLTIQDGNLVVANGHGIDFSATGNGSGTMSSELLDDYEEGTFTPAWGDSSAAYSSPSPTYTTQTGHYTKVGNTVYFDFNLATSNWNGSGSTMWVHGMPYAARNSGGYQQAISGSFCIQGVDGTNSINTLTGQMQPGVSLIQLYYQTASSGNNYNTFSTAGVAETTNVNIRFNGFYFI